MSKTNRDYVNELYSIAELSLESSDDVGKEPESVPVKALIGGGSEIELIDEDI